MRSSQRGNFFKKRCKRRAFRDLKFFNKLRQQQRIVAKTGYNFAHSTLNFLIETIGKFCRLSLTNCESRLQEVKFLPFGLVIAASLSNQLPSRFFFLIFERNRVISRHTGYLHKSMPLFCSLSFTLDYFCICNCLSAFQFHQGLSALGTKLFIQTYFLSSPTF